MKIMPTVDFLCKAPPRTRRTAWQLQLHQKKRGHQRTVVLKTEQLITYESHAKLIFCGKQHPEQDVQLGNYNSIKRKGDTKEQKYFT